MSKDGLNVSVQGTEWLNQQQLQELAKDDKNRVYTYTHDKPEHVMGADEVRDRIRNIRERYLHYRALHPEWDDDKIRHYICSEKYCYRDFAKSHSLNFMNTTNRDTDEKKMNYQYYMLYVKKQVELGMITEEQSRPMVQEYFLKESMKKTPKRNNK
jgi:hypothetical protein